MELELFKIELNDKNRRQLKRIRTWATLLFIFALCTGLFNLFSGYKLIKFYSAFPTSGIFKIQSTGNIVFLGLYGCVIPLQAYFLYNFVSKFKVAILFDRIEEFSLSLQWLLKQIVVATILFGLNTCWAVTSVLIIPIW